MPGLQKFLKSIFLLLSVLMILCGCAGAGGQNNAENTKIVTDMIGREVAIPIKPERIVCLYAATAHMMALVGETEKIIGAPGGIKRDILLRTKYPGIVDISTPAQEGTINAEEMLRIEPDLVLVRRNIADSPSESEKLDRLGIPFVVVDFFSIDDVKACLRIIGEIFDKQDIASQYIGHMDEVLLLVETRLDGLEENDKIRLFHSTNEALRTVMRGGISDEITKLAGVINVSVHDDMFFDAHTANTTIEQLYLWDPDVIVVNENTAVQYIMLNDKWGGLSAVINEMVVPLPLGISRWAHQGSIEPHMAAFFIAWRFYPELFSDIDMHETIKNYYTRFFELDMDDELVDRIITGEGMREPKGQN